MYTGQFGIALAGKGLLPRVPLWALIAAAFGLDLASTILALCGVQGAAGAWSESAAGVLVVAGVAGAIYYALGGRDVRGALVMAVAAVLHLPADLVASEVLLWPGGPTVGGALYQHPAVDFTVEALVMLGGWLLYRRSLTPEGRHRWPVWAIPVVLLIAQAAFSFGWRFWA